ncbi:hypothetical protein BMS3Bbin04_01257 [bacterium BMS3Bbin04]|nr:hypothetical protein BMS3Bbin04_01257 [bacterium BMS3Bbin04]
MWIIRWIVLVVIIVAVLGFSLQNQGQIDGITLLNWYSGPIPLYVALFVAFALGMISFLLIAVFQQLQTLSELGRMKRQKKKLEAKLAEITEEVENLRDESEHNDTEKERLRQDIELYRDRLEEARGGEGVDAVEDDEEE